jgi:hypothetical protein
MCPLSGCGTTRRIDGGRLEPRLIGVTPPGVGSNARVRTASCPSVAVKRDALVRCRVRLSDGSTGTWVWSVTDELTGAVESSFFDADKNNPPKLKPLPYTVGDAQSGPAQPSRLKVTLTRYVPPAAGATPQITEADFSVTNVGQRAYSDDYDFASYAAVYTKDGGVWGDVYKERRACGAPLYAAPFRLARGQTVHGCVWFKATPETSGYGPPVEVSVDLDIELDWSVGRPR